jgi:peptidoglycan/xylan/chitin deacetylase (PgdA/CDA1 family)
VILVYHSVATVDSDPWDLHVSPENFSDHLEIIRRHYRPIDMQSLASCVVDGRIPARSVAVTFDDGYSNNLTAALPLLERHDVAATVFVTTGFLGSAEEMWWDALDRIMLFSGDMAPTAERRNAYFEQWDLLVRLPSDLRRTIIAEMAQENDEYLQARSTHRLLTDEELMALSGGRLIEIGAHTVTHPALAALPSRQQRDEIVASKKDIEERIGKPVHGFAYPYGQSGHFTQETVDLVATAGFSYACANMTGHVDRNSDRYRLPRLHVRNWSTDEFAWHLKNIFTA